MGYFRISDILDSFTYDLRRIMDESRAALQKLIIEPADEAARNAVWRNGHTLRGLGLQVEAHALAKWGGELERLCASAQGWLPAEPGRVSRIFSFVVGHLGDWEQLNARTIEENFEEADSIYESLRTRLELDLASLLVSSGEHSPASQSPADEPAAAAPKGRKFAPLAPARVRLPTPGLKLEGSSDAPSPAAQTEDVGQAFLAEIRTSLIRMRPECMSLEADSARERSWQELHRLFLTVKGAAAALGREAVLAHATSGADISHGAIQESAGRTFGRFERCLQEAIGIAQEIGFEFAEFGEAPETHQPGAASGYPPAPPDEVDPELVESFVEDAHQQTDALEQATLRWERGESAEQQAASVKRCFHTLKGAANSIGLRRFGASVHAVEDYLDRCVEPAGQSDPAFIAFLLRAVDEIRQYTAALETNKKAAWSVNWLPLLSASGVARPVAAGARAEVDRVAPAPTQPGAEETVTGSIRITTDRLEELRNLIGDTVIDRNRLLARLVHLQSHLVALKEKDHRFGESVASFYDQFEFNLMKDQHGPIRDGGAALAPVGAVDHGFSELEFDRYDQFNILSRSLLEMAEDVHQVIRDMEENLSALVQDTDSFSQNSRRFQNHLTGLSMAPMEALFPRLERAFRDALSSGAKEADLSFEGGATQIDRVLLDALHAPLLHLLRNAIAHGIEAPEVRAAAGKPVRGAVRFSSRQAADRVVIELSDDGAGIDADAVRRAAVRKGFLAADAGALSSDQVRSLLCRPGFSTADEVTSIAGRGVGMDVVVTDIERRGGTLELAFAPGQGTTWRLHMPLTLLISEAVVVEAGGRRFALPLNQVQTGVLVPEPLLAPGRRTGSYRLGDQVCPAYSLCDLLGFPGSPQPSHGVLLAIGERRSLLLIDRLIGRQEIVVKPLDPLTARHPLLNGATLDPEGRVIPILDAGALIKYADAVVMLPSRSAVPRASRGRAEKMRPPRVLIVDDSLSVRKVQEGLIRRLGCDPVLAVDGLDGLEKLRGARVDLVLSDLEMPRLNGYEFISEMRTVPAWTAIPVIVVSSRSADKYITRALQSGAHSFLPKPFNEAQLSALLHQHLGWETKTREPELAQA